MEKCSKRKKMECKFHRMLMFFLPLFYAIETRFLKRSKFGIIIWATEYLIPIIISLWLVKLNFEGWYYWVLSILSVYNLYEIGYIQNDCETIKHESNPTLRVSSEELRFYEKWKCYIYGLRFFIGILCTIFFLNFGARLVPVILLWLILPIYVIYNYLRGRINLYLIFLLTAYRYCTPIWLVCDIVKNDKSTILLTVLIVYPFLKLIEICAGGKSLPPEKWTKLFLKDFNSRFLFRIKYYFILSLILGCLQYIGKIHLYWLLPLYFLLLRGCQFKMPKLGAR